MRKNLWKDAPPVIATLPQRKAIIKTITLPSRDPRELREMVRLQAYRQIPLAPEEMQAAYQPLETLPEGATKLLMIVVRKTDVQARLEELARTGVFPDQLFLDSPGISFTETANLLPDEEQARKRSGRNRNEWLRYAGAAGLLLALGGACFALRFHRQKQVLARLTQEEKVWAAQTKDLRRMGLQTGMIRTQLARKGTLLHVLAELNELVPGRISLQTIAFAKGRTLEIQGTSFSLSDTLRLVQELQKSPLFSKVELVSSNNRRLQDQDVVDFQVACQLGIAL